jgi:hypothetical protein
MGCPHGFIRSTVNRDTAPFKRKPQDMLKSLFMKTGLRVGRPVALIQAADWTTFA